MTKYYHGLAGGIPYWYQEEIFKESVKTLESILTLGGIYSREILEKYGFDFSEKLAPYNGDSYISVCIENPDAEEFRGSNVGLDSSFFRYVRRKIAIEFNDDLEEKCLFRKEPYLHLPGERQILNSIPISNIKRVLVGLNGEIQQQALKEIQKLCEPYNISVVTFDEAKEKDNLNQKNLVKEKK